MSCYGGAKILHRTPAFSARSAWVRVPAQLLAPASCYCGSWEFPGMALRLRVPTPMGETQIKLLVPDFGLAQQCLLGASEW